MSYSHSKRKKNNKFKNKIAKTFEDFCSYRNVSLITLTKEEYDLQYYYWLSYKQFYSMEHTIQEKAWLANYRKEDGEE